MKVLPLYFGKHPYGLPIGLIREIIGDYNYTPVERAAEDLVGLLNLRGQIVTVLSPGVLLGHGVSGNSPKKRIVILKKNDDLGELEKTEGGQDGISGDLYAFEVDAIGEVHTVKDAVMDAIPGNTPEKERRFLTGIVRVDGGVLPVLHVARLICGKDSSTKEEDSDA